MKKITFLILSTIFGIAVFANYNNVIFVNNEVQNDGKTDISSQVVIKNELPCSVTVNKSGNVSGVDCNGNFYSQGTIGSGTGVSETCETAFIQANNSANTALSNENARQKQWHEHDKCNIQ